MVPKVKFEIMSLEESFEYIYRFLNPRKGKIDHESSVYRYFPELADILRNIKDEDEKYKTTKKFVTKIYNDSKGDIENNVSLFQKEWDKVNEKVLEKLEEILNTKWNADIKIITARVGLAPTCPRNIAKNEFIVDVRSNIEWMKPMSAHELLHFIWFQKWKEMYEDYDIVESCSPHLIWYISEMVVDPILNDNRIKDILKHNSEAYGIFYSTYINENESLIDRMRWIYNNSNNIEDFICKSYDFAKENQELIINSAIKKD